MSQQVIGTHSGPFHADDVMAVALLRRHPQFQGAAWLRSRDTEALDKCDIVVDVGEEFDHERKRYDHHQRDFSLTMSMLSRHKIKSNTQLSSAGLVYWYYGRDIIAHKLQLEQSELQLEWIFVRVYWNIINEIDWIDNHGSAKEFIKTGISSRIASLNPDWEELEADYDTRFETAMEEAWREFVHTLNRAVSDWRAKAALTERVKRRREEEESGRVLVLTDKYVAWQSLIGEVEKEEGLGRDNNILYIITEKPGDIFGINVVKNRRPFPEAWRGMSGSDLEAVCGLKGARFVHSGGHYATTSTKEAAMELVNIMLRR